MENSGSKESLADYILSLPEDFYHLIIVRDKTVSLNQLHTVLRKSKPHGVKFDDWKEQIKEKHGLFYFEGEQKIYRSFTKLTNTELTHLLMLEDS
jgi:hypothetical protein